MAFKSLSVAVLTSNTDVVECPATQEGAAKLTVSNVTGSSSTYTLKLYRQSTGQTVTLRLTEPIAAYTTLNLAPISLEAGDKIIMTAPSNSIIVAGGAFTYSAATPAAVGFTPKGDWSGLTTYQINDVVSFTDGKSYISRTADNLDNQPDENPANWMVLADRGEPGEINVLDEDDMASNSATEAPSQQSVKAYVDALLGANDAMIFKNVIDCSTNPNYPAADRGHTYKVSVAGKIGGGSGPNVQVGDLLICITDSTSSGNHATVGSAWAIIQANIDGAITIAGGSTLTGGFKGTSYDAGTKSSGTFTPDPLNSNIQHYTNGGAHTLAPPSDACSIVIDMTNNGSAGAVTTSGFTKVTGDNLTTTNTNKFRLYVTVGNAGSHLHKQALQ